MTDFTDQVVAYVHDISWRKRPANGWWLCHVEDIARALDVPTTSVLTALRKAEDRQLLTCYYGLDEWPHSCRLGERHGLTP